MDPFLSLSVSARRHRTRWIVSHPGRVSKFVSALHRQGMTFLTRNPRFIFKKEKELDKVQDSDKDTHWLELEREKLQEELHRQMHIHFSNKRHANEKESEYEQNKDDNDDNTNKCSVMTTADRLLGITGFSYRCHPLYRYTHDLTD